MTCHVARVVGRLIGVLAALLLAAVLPLRDSAAQSAGYDSIDGCAGSWRQQFGVDVLVLDCAPGFVRDHDRAYMYLRGGAPSGGDWRSQLNFSDAIWMFDAGADGRISLIIDFHRDGEALVADVYDDVNGDGEIRFGLERGYPRSIESRFPSVRVVAPGGWWERGGVINYDLDLFVDGPIVVSPDGGQIADWLTTDGVVDARIKVRGTPGAGRPSQELVQVTPPISDDPAVYVFFRTLFRRNEADDEPPTTTYILWPHLGYAGSPQEMPTGAQRPRLVDLAGAAYGVNKGAKASFPPIQVDWDQARIRTVGEFVASTGRARAWFLASHLRIGRAVRSSTDGGEIANGTNPYAAYDIAGANDGRPDLTIHDTYSVSDRPTLPALLGDASRHAIDYSWFLRGLPGGYRLQLFGSQPMPGLVDIGDGVRFRGVPYDELPGWTVGSRWSAAAFITSERRTQSSLEGIAGVCETCGRTPYYFGTTATKPDEQFGSLGIETRAEYVSFLDEPVELYVGPIDRKLHLYGAESGRWRTGRREEIVYRAEDGSRFVNRWKYAIDGAVVQTLSHVGDQLILADRDGVRIGKVRDGSAPVLIKPPADRAGFDALRRHLAEALPAGEGADLESLFARAVETQITLPGLLASEVRATQSGFRLVAHVPDPAPVMADLPSLPAGPVVLSHDGAELRARPATLPQLSLSSPTVMGDPPTIRFPVRLAFQVRNEGDRDALGVPVVLLAGRPGQAGEPAAWTTVNVRAGETVPVETTWVPLTDGDWSLRALLIGTYATGSSPVPVDVAPPPPTDPGSIFLAQGLSPSTGGAITASLTLLGATAVGLGLVLFRPPSPVRTDDD